MKLEVALWGQPERDQQLRKEHLHLHRALTRREQDETWRFQCIFNHFHMRLAVLMGSLRLLHPCAHLGGSPEFTFDFQVAIHELHEKFTRKPTSLEDAPAPWILL